MNLTEILDGLLLLAIVASAIVGIAKPKPKSFWWKVIRMLTYVSFFNPRNVKVIPLEDFEQSKEDKKDASNDN